MDLPESVQANADRADELEQVLAEPAPEVGTETGETEEQQQNPTVAESDSEKWEAKYRTLQGMYNAELPRAKRERDELQARLDAALNEVRQLREAVAGQEEDTQYITDEDSEVFGEDMVDLTQRAAKQEAAKYSREAAQLRNDVERLKEQLGQVSKTTYQNTQQQYLNRLSELVPDWEQQNTDKGFLRWLDEPDPLVGGTRKQALDEAYNSLNARRTAEIFMAYRNAGSPRPQLSRAQMELQKQVAPTGRGTTLMPSEGTKRVFTQDDIARFYENAVHGRYTSEQAAALEKEIDQAVAEGRVR